MTQPLCFDHAIKTEGLPPFLLYTYYNINNRNFKEIYKKVIFDAVV